jgi:hypothetical protein
MFQAAFAAAISEYYGKKALLIDATDRAGTRRSWELGCFGLAPQTVSSVRRESIILADALARKLLPVRMRSGIGVLHEDLEGRCPMFGSRPPWLVSGYWQGSRYIAASREKIKGLFKCSDAAKAALCVRLPLQSGVVGMHVRRGDYAGTSETARYHCVCSSEWYSKAWDCVRRQCGSAKLLVFSEDPDWVRQMVKPEGDVEYVPFDSTRPAWMDLIAFSQCKHFILSNSSFSWWAAYLGESDESVVVAPSQWYPGVESSDAGMLMRGWMPLSVAA